MRDSLFILNDGRKLGYIEYGNPDGLPIFLFHGTPGSRIFGLEDEPLIQKENLRVITPERPGYGVSDPLKDREIISFPQDIEELANSLEIGTFHVAGVSGGGPYALSCACKLPNRILSVTLIGSATPTDMKGYFKGMSLGNKFALALSKYFPYLLKPIYKYAASLYRKNPEKLFDGLKSQLCEWDLAVLEKMKEKGRMKGFTEHIREAYKQGSKAAYTDTLLVSKPWNITFEHIKAPIFMWHGESDTLMPIHPAKQFSKILPNCQSNFISGAGHFLLEDTNIGQRIIHAVKETNT